MNYVTDQYKSNDRANVGPVSARVAIAIGLIASVVSISTSLVLVTQHRVLSGPGDQIVYYKQASSLIPFQDHYYGPVYFIGLRLVHNLTGLDWFPSGRLLSWLSSLVVLALSYVLTRKVLGSETGPLALALVALNPTFIGQSYSGLTITHGAAWGLAAIVCALYAAPSRRAWPWALCGLVFGLAGLCRTQNNALLIGAVAGLFVMPGVTFKGRLARAMYLLAGGLLPGLAWKVLLLQTQGFAPANHNFVHLTIALGDFQTFFDVEPVIRKYGSMLGVLTSHWSAPIQILAFGAKEAVKFPFRTGFELLFLAAGWLLPGLMVVARRRFLHQPWLIAFLACLFLTGLASQGWLHYYTMSLPICAILVALGVRCADSDQNQGPRRYFGPGWLAWMVILGSTALWSPVLVWSDFKNVNWAELVPANAYLDEKNRAEPVTICSTASTVGYGTGCAFVDQTAIMRPAEADQLVDRLRQYHVTHLVVTQRHTLFEFPELEYLLQDQVPDLPAGLRRELLISQPRRLTIYRVLPASVGGPSS